MAPGVVLSIAFLAAVALTALAFVMERKEGLLERSLVAGIYSIDFHSISQLICIRGQLYRVHALPCLDSTTGALSTGGSPSNLHVLGLRDPLQRAIHLGRCLDFTPRFVWYGFRSHDICHL